MPPCIASSCVVTILLFGFISFCLYKESERVYGLLNDDFYDVDVETAEHDKNTRVYLYMAYFMIAIGAALMLPMI
jgi:hypothetical protein